MRNIEAIFLAPLFLITMAGLMLNFQRKYMRPTSLMSTCLSGALSYFVRSSANESSPTLTSAVSVMATAKREELKSPSAGGMKEDKSFSLGIQWPFSSSPSQVKSRFTLLGGKKKATCRGSGPDWRAGAGARVWSPLPPGLSKESGER